MIKNKKIIIGTIFLVVLIPLLTLGFLSATNTYMFSRNLTVKDTTTSSMGNDRWFDLYDGDVYFGELLIRVGSSRGAVTKIVFDTPNTHEDYVVDSILLKFSTGGNTPTNVYMDCNCPEVSTTFKQDIYGTTIKITGMEVYRGGSTPISFMVESYRNLTLSINADVTYHETSLLQLTCSRAHVLVNTQIETN